MQGNPGPVRHQREIDKMIQAWTTTTESTEALEVLRTAEVPSAPMHPVADISSDPHLIARGLFEPLPLPSHTDFKAPAMHPRLLETRGQTSTPGPVPGANTDDVLLALPTMDSDRLAALHRDGVVA